MRKSILLALLLIAPATAVFAQSVQTQGTLSATGSVRLETSGMGTASVTVSGTFVGTITFEVLGDLGAPAVAVDCFTPDDAATAVNSVTSTGVWTCSVAGLKGFQARMSAYTSGTARIFLAAAPTGGGGGGGGASGSNAAAGTTGAAVPGSASYTGVNVASNLVGLTGMSLGSQIALPVAIVDSSGVQITPNAQDPCEAATRTQVLINQTTSTQVLAGTSSVKIYVCSFHLISATAQNIAVVEGTGSVCATGIAGVAGGTTAATGWNLAANSGLSLGTGGKWIMQTATNADNFCILQSGAGQVSGSFTYVKQ